LLFGHTRSRIRVFQLYVTESHRGHNIGRELISELKNHAASKGVQTVTARVAADLPANHFWERQGFRIARQLRGGASSDRIINDRLFEVCGCSLWEPTDSSGPELSKWPVQQQPILSTPTFAIDLNVLFDVVKDREHATLVQDIIGNAMGNEYRLCVTAEFARELERRSEPEKGDPILKLARSLPTLPDVPSTSLTTLKEGLKTLLFPEPGRSVKRAPNDQSDLSHLALCIHHKISGFVTREAAILKKARDISETHGIEVFSPADLLASIAVRITDVFPIRARIGGTTFAFSPLEEKDRERAERFLASLGLSRPRINLVLASGTKSSPRTRIIFTLGEVVIAFASWETSRNETTVYLVANESLPVAQRAVEHVLQSVANALSGAHLTRICFSTHLSQVASRETATKRGYVLSSSQPTEDGFVAHSRYGYPGIVSEKNWERFSTELEAATGSRITRRFPTYSELSNTGLLFEYPSTNTKTVVPLFRLETAFSPVLVLGRGRPAVISPIQEDFANELIPLATRQYALLAKEAPAHLERAYYGKPGIERAFPRGAVVIFYISGKRNEAVGFGRVTASGRYPIDVALSTFSRQGVLSGDDLAAIGSNGHVGVFTFDSYRNFRRAIPFSALRNNGIANAANLVTSQQISYEQLRDVFALGESS
jgi:hypothetical protein